MYGTTSWGVTVSGGVGFNWSEPGVGTRWCGRRNQEGRDSGED